MIIQTNQLASFAVLRKAAIFVTEQVVSFQMGTETTERLSNLLEMQSWVSDPGF